MKKNICKAFANKTRLRLVLCLDKPKTVSELLSHCTLSQSALSQHLKVLKDTGIVSSSKNGKFVYYSVQDRNIRKIATLVSLYI